MKRGDLVTVALRGNLGKPRPAVIIQDDRFLENPSSVVVCLLTTHSYDAPLFRVPVEPDKENGLRQPSEIMIDKVATVEAARLGPIIGHLDDTTLTQINRSLMVFYGLVT